MTIFKKQSRYLQIPKGLWEHKKADNHKSYINNMVSMIH